MQEPKQRSRATCGVHFRVRQSWCDALHQRMCLIQTLDIMGLQGPSMSVGARVSLCIGAQIYVIFELAKSDWVSSWDERFVITWTSTPPVGASPDAHTF